MGTRRLKIYFDGSARPNPGPVTIAVVARGVATITSLDQAGDSCEAEWAALIAAARMARGLGADDVLLLGDALTVVEQANGRWPCRRPALLAACREFGEVTAPVARATVRHVGRAQNLAGIALDRHLADTRA